MRVIEKLFINRYNGSDLNFLKDLINLKSLAILNAPIENVDCLNALKKLNYLRLANLKRLRSISGIKELTKLEELEIDTCRAISSIEEIANLVGLRKLQLNNMGVVNSLTPLENLVSLELVLFYGSTNILDGNLSSLLKLKRLSRISFQNRQHYSHRREGFGAAYTG